MKTKTKIIILLSILCVISLITYNYLIKNTETQKTYIFENAELCYAGDVMIDSYNVILLDTEYNTGRIYIDGILQKELGYRCNDFYGTLMFYYNIYDMPENKLFNIEIELYDKEGNIAKQYTMNNVYLCGDINLKKLKKVENIKYLITTGLTKGSLEHISIKDTIQGLFVLDSEFNDSLSTIGSMTNLKALNIRYNLPENEFEDSNISQLSKLVNLNMLSLFRVKSHGDISCFESIKGLEMLMLIQNENIEGDINSLSNMNELKYLNLVGNEIYGQVQNIYCLNNLEMLRIASSDNLVINTNEIHSLVNLNVFIYNSLSNKGNNYISFKDFSDLGKLTVLKILSNGEVLGDLRDIKEISSLEIVDIRSNTIIGDIGSLHNLVHLKTLIIHSDNIRGDISLLSSCEQLEKLWIKSKSENISGTLELVTGETIYMD